MIDRGIDMKQTRPVDEKIKKELEAAVAEGNGGASLFNDLDSEFFDVKLLTWTKNPYIPLVEMHLNTYGDKTLKWNDLSPKTRFYIAKKVLERKGYPLALEAPQFTFWIQGVTRSAFDEIARARIGVVFSSRGFKDNDLNGLSFVKPYILDKNDEEELEDFYLRLKDFYLYLRNKYPGWASRYIIPMGAEYHFSMTANYSSLQNFCARRMETTEQTDVVAVAWKIQNRIAEKFELLGNYLRPASDFAHRDLTVESNWFSWITGLPHSSDGRYPTTIPDYIKVEHDYPCTDVKFLKKSGIKVLAPGDYKDLELNNLKMEERQLFYEMIE
jgi:thymidylate synthase ThyX